MTDETTISEADVASVPGVLDASAEAEIDDSSFGLVFRVLPPNGEWFADGERFAADADGAPGETHRIEDPSPELVKLAGSAHNAGVIEVTVGLDEGHIESQEDSEKAYTAAQGEWVEPTTRPDGTTEPGYWTGPWLEGHLLAEGDAPGQATTHIDIEPAKEES